MQIRIERVAFSAAGANVLGGAHFALVAVACANGVGLIVLVAFLFGVNGVAGAKRGNFIVQLVGFQILMNLAACIVFVSVAHCFFRFKCWGSVVQKLRKQQNGFSFYKAAVYQIQHHVITADTSLF